MTKSCITCPSFTTEDDAASAFGGSVGAPVCARFAKVLGRPTASPAANKKMQETIAESCSSYGEPNPRKPIKEGFFVSTPDPHTIGYEPHSDQQKGCTSCISCSNFIPDDIVAKEFGFPRAMCAAKGKLLFPHRYKIEAKDCDHREFGSHRKSIQGMNLYPEYADAAEVDPIKNYFEAQRNFVDPVDYPTDMEVAPEDADRIRAWRRVSDPEGFGDDIYLPIYRIEKFPENTQALVPRTGDDEHPELYADHQSLLYQVGVMWQELDETPAFWGQAGVGKTEFFRYAAWMMCLPFHRLSITEKTEIDDLMGKMQYSPERGTYFHYGRLPSAWKSPGVICLDEPNTGPPAVWQAVRPLTDNSKQLILDQNEGERIHRHPDSCLGFAMNPAWDPKNIGATEIGDADMNRLMHLFLELPPPEIERRILIKRCELDGWTPTDKLLSAVMQVAETVRELIENGTLPQISWGIRPQIKVVRALRWFKPPTAYRRAIGDAMEPTARDAILDQVRACMPDDVDWRSK